MKGIGNPILINYKYFVIFVNLINNIKDFFMRCTHCGSLEYVKNGCYQGSQRFKCKQCNRYFSDKVRKFTFADKERFLAMQMNNVGLRKSAKLMGCSHTLLLRWIKEFAQNLKRQLEVATEHFSDANIPDVIEMDEIYTRVKKGEIKFRYGLLILGSDVKLLRL